MFAHSGLFPLAAKAAARSARTKLRFVTTLASPSWGHHFELHFHVTPPSQILLVTVSNTHSRLVGGVALAYTHNLALIMLSSANAKTPYSN
jgi:hypothetical protein